MEVFMFWTGVVVWFVTSALVVYVVGSEVLRAWLVVWRTSKLLKPDISWRHLARAWLYEIGNGNYSHREYSSGERIDRWGRLE